MKIILLEALLTSFAAGVLGYFVGFGASRYVAPMLSMTGNTIPMNHQLLGFAILLAVGVGMVSSIYPAYKASRLDPMVALRAL